MGYKYYYRNHTFFGNTLSITVPEETRFAEAANFAVLWTKLKER